MRRILLVVAMAAMVVAMLGVSAGPALADHVGGVVDDGVIDDSVLDDGVLDDDDGVLDDGVLDDDDEGGVICPDEDEEAELLLGFGFVCVDDDDDEDKLDHSHSINHHDDLDDSWGFDDHHGLRRSFVD